MEGPILASLGRGRAAPIRLGPEDAGEGAEEGHSGAHSASMHYTRVFLTAALSLLRQKHVADVRSEAKEAAATERKRRAEVQKRKEARVR